MLSHFHPSEDGLVLYEASSEVYCYSEAGTWSVSSLNTGVNANNNVEAIMNRPLRHRGKMYGLVPRPMDLIKEALEDHSDNLCIARQISVILEICFHRLCDRFDDMLGSQWRDHGISSNQIEAVIKS